MSGVRGSRIAVQIDCSGQTTLLLAFVTQVVEGKALSRAAVGSEVTLHLPII